MKRVLWLLLCAWCTAFAQVQPVAVKPAETPTCCCGETCACDNGCGILATLPSAPTPAERTTATVETRRGDTQGKRLAPVFSISAPSASAPALAVRAGQAPPDAVPRFCRLCVFRI